MGDVMRLVERVGDWRGADLVVDQERRVVRNVALVGTSSRNGYRYSEEALRGALPRYENKPVFLDHAANVARPQERSTRDLVGSIVNARFEGGRVRGDIQVLDTEAGRTFLALAEASTAAVGMSQVVLAQRSADQSVVESIQDVVSVDAVTFPATSATFRESEDDARGLLPVGDAEEELRAALRAVEEERDSLLREVARLREVERGVLVEREVAELMAGSRLPAECLSEGFRRQLAEAGDRATRVGLIEERRQLVEVLGRRGVCSRERSAGGVENVEALVVAAVRRR